MKSWFGFGKHISGSERKAMTDEIKRQIQEYDERHSSEIAAMVMWVLHEQFGYGVEELHKFHDAYMSHISSFSKRTDISSDDKFFVYTAYCKTRLGIDVAEWRKEYENGGI